MAISRLFAAETKTKLQLKNKGILKPRRWFFSESPPTTTTTTTTTPNSKREAAREKKAEKIRSFIDSYMLRQPGVLPKTKEVHEIVGGSWYTVKNILSEMKTKILPSAQIDKRTVVEASNEASLVEENLDSDKLYTKEGSVSFKEMLDVEESHITEVKNSEASEISNDGNVAELKQMEQLTGMLDIKTSEADCQTERQTVLKSSNGDNAFFDKSDRSEQGFAFSKELFDVRKSHVTEVKDSEAMGIGSSKTETCSQLKEGKKHVTSLLDVFTRNQIDSEDDNLIREKKLEQGGFFNLKKVRGDPGNPGMNAEVKDILDHIIDLPKVCSMTDAPSNKARSELWSFVSGSMNHLCLNEEQTSENQLYKTEIRKSEGQKEKDKLTEVLGAKNQRGEKQPGVQEIERKMSPFEQDNTANNLREESDPEVAAFDYAKPEPSYKLPLPIRGPNLSTSENAGPKNLLLIKFLLKTATANDICRAFGDCGHISNIRIVNSERTNKFNYAYISFKDEKGMKKALRKSGVSICNADVVTEAASASKACNKMFNIMPVKDVHFPRAFLKNPSRTVMIKGFPENLSFFPLRDAFSKWGRVSSIAMGSSPSNAYIEFESEEAKEKILAEAKVSVSGKELSILRVDAPKTTVVRISNLSPLSKLEKIHSICDTYGQVKRVVSRDVDVIDVHFTLSEWTNLVEIINRLNGLVVDQCQWLAQPATIIPAEVLQALFKKPGGRKRIHQMFESICKRIEENSIDTTAVLGLAKKNILW